jgi:excisionase family DNA binding protein
MTSRGGRGPWERVLVARRQAQAALGRDPNSPDLYSASPPKAATPLPEPRGPVLVAIHASERSAKVLSLGEAATRLGVSRTALEAMIDAGKVEALPTGFTRMIPTREVDRLKNQT